MTPDIAMGGFIGFLALILLILTRVNNLRSLQKKLNKILQNRAKKQSLSDRHLLKLSKSTLKELGKITAHSPLLIEVMSEIKGIANTTLPALLRQRRELQAVIENLSAELANCKKNTPNRSYDEDEEGRDPVELMLQEMKKNIRLLTDALIKTNDKIIECEVFLRLAKSKMMVAKYNSTAENIAEVQSTMTGFRKKLEVSIEDAENARRRVSADLSLVLNK